MDNILALEKELWDAADRHSELASLNKEANELMSEIMKEWETLNTK